MQAVENLPPGVAGVLGLVASPDGRVVAHVADFEEGRPGGFSLLEAQTSRVKSALARAVATAFCSTDFEACVSTDECARVLDRMIREKAYVRTIIPIGHAAARSSATA